MNAKETITFDGRKVDLEWFGETKIPKNIKVSQVVGFCANKNNEILLVKNRRGRGWGFPGGHPEAGESTIQTLRREIDEEASVLVGTPKLVGYLKVKDPTNQAEKRKSYIQLRYFARTTRVKKFKGDWETSERKFVPVQELPKYITWALAPTGKAQLDCINKFINK